MRRRGLFRLWVAITVIFVPGLAFWTVNDNMNTWAELDRITVEQCVNEESTLASHPDATECIHRQGADQTMFQHEQITPGAYWAEALGIAFVVDLIVTAILIGLFLAARWVVRGFKAE